MWYFWKSFQVLHLFLSHHLQPIAQYVRRKRIWELQVRLMHVVIMGRLDPCLLVRSPNFLHCRWQYRLLLFHAHHIRWWFPLLLPQVLSPFGHQQPWIQQRGDLLDWQGCMNMYEAQSESLRRRQVRKLNLWSPVILLRDIVTSSPFFACRNFESTFERVDKCFPRHWTYLSVRKDVLPFFDVIIRTQW